MYRTLRLLLILMLVAKGVSGQKFSIQWITVLFLHRMCVGAATIERWFSEKSIGGFEFNREESYLMFLFSVVQLVEAVSVELYLMLLFLIQWKRVE
jgi:hypothetical protein